MPELDIPDDLKCIVQTELTKHAQSLRTLLSFHETVNTYSKTDFCFLKGKKKKKTPDA